VTITPVLRRLVCWTAWPFLISL